MLDTSLDVPLGYGGSVGIGVSAPLFPPTAPIGPGWTSGWWGPGWSIGGPVRPPVRPGVVVGPPAVRPPNQGSNWRPPVNNPRPPANTPQRPSNIQRPPASTSTPPITATPVTRPGRH